MVWNPSAILLSKKSRWGRFETMKKFIAQMQLTPKNVRRLIVALIIVNIIIWGTALVFKLITP